MRIEDQVERPVYREVRRRRISPVVGALEELALEDISVSGQQSLPEATPPDDLDSGLKRPQEGAPDSLFEWGADSDSIPLSTCSSFVGSDRGCCLASGYLLVSSDLESLLFWPGSRAPA